MGDFADIGFSLPDGLPHKEYTVTDGLVSVVLDASGGVNMVEYQGPRRIGVRHFHEAEAARLAGVTVGDQGDGLDRAVLSEQRADRGFVGRKGQVTNVDLAH